MDRLSRIAEMAKKLETIDAPVVQEVDRHVRSGDMFPPGDWHNRIKGAEDAEKEKTLKTADAPKVPSGEWLTRVKPEDGEKDKKLETTDAPVVQKVDGDAPSDDKVSRGEWLARIKAAEDTEKKD